MIRGGDNVSHCYTDSTTTIISHLYIVWGPRISILSGSMNDTNIAKPISNDKAVIYNNRTVSCWDQRTCATKQPLICIHLLHTTLVFCEQLINVKYTDLRERHATRNFGESAV